MTRRRSPVIAGLGITEVGKVYGRTAADFGADAVRLAVADAGLELSAVDGLLTSSGVVASGRVGLDLQRELGLRDLKLLSEVQAFGSSAGAMITYASMAIQSGMADTIVCVFADAPLRENRSTGSAYAGARKAKGWHGLRAASGALGANPLYAIAARRHMLEYGTTSEQFGAVAVAQRRWAARNPLAQLRKPITLEDHQASRMIAEPFHLLDCCLVSNGGVAVVVTSAERAALLPRPPVHVLGWGQGHPGYAMCRGSDFGLRSGATSSGAAALDMAGVKVSEVDIVELYDCYTFTVLITLEDYGFCPKGEGGPFVAEALGPGGKLAVNTGGGQLSSYYLWGMTPISEAIIQARVHGGERQAPNNDVIMVSGNGGVLDHHSTLVLSPHAPQGGVH